MSVVWALADALDLTPMPPNATLAATLAGWWSRPRVVGCPALRADVTAPWFVLLPDPTAVCGTCAAGRLEEERRCAYCHEDVLTEQVRLAFEMRGVTVVGRAHTVCHEEETR